MDEEVELVNCRQDELTNRLTDIGITAIRDRAIPTIPFHATTEEKTVS